MVTKQKGRRKSRGRSEKRSKTRHDKATLEERKWEDKKRSVFEKAVRQKSVPLLWPMSLNSIWEGAEDGQGSFTAAAGLLQFPLN